MDVACHAVDRLSGTPGASDERAGESEINKVTINGRTLETTPGGRPGQSALSARWNAIREA